MARQRDLHSKVEELWKSTSEVEQEMKSLEELNATLGSIPTTWQRPAEEEEEECRNLAETRAALEEDCLKSTDFIAQTRQLVLQQLKYILSLAGQIVSTLLTVDLPEWKRRQQCACTGSPANTHLDHLESWFTKVTQVLLQVHQQLAKIQAHDEQSIAAVPQLVDAARDAQEVACALLKTLLESALVVEKQPAVSKGQRPLVLKTTVKFTVAVRFLVNLREFWDRLKVKPVFDKDVKEVETLKGFRQFDLVNDSSMVLHVNSPQGGLTAEFGPMTLEERKVRTKGCDKSLRVTEELHIITFGTSLQFAGLDCNIEASTLPLVVITSTNQCSSAWASIMWCTMLTTSEQKNLSLFLKPKTVTWQQLSAVLSWQFLAVGQRALDENQLSALRDKFVDNHDGLVHWKKFSNPHTSAWIWLEGILDLIQKHLLDLWKDGCIMGFVSKKTTEVLLREKQSGTFLLRFSETKKEGAVSFSWVDHSNGETYVHPVDPYTKNELSVMRLADIIYHYSVTDQMNTTRNPLVYLYPDVHKDVAFGRYRVVPATTAPVSVDGYVRRKHLLSSADLTPPPSPPRDPPMMDDSDMDIDPVVEDRHVIADLFPAVLDVIPVSP